MDRPTDNPKSSANGALNSWKRIAAYLGKTVRTVQRWEQEEGLPVLRHQHGKRGTVYASKEDIDTWLADRTVTNTQEAAAHRPALLALGLAFAFFAALAGIWLTPRTETEEPSEAILTFEERPWVLIVPLENLTGDPLLTDALGYSLYQGLVATHRVNIASLERVQDTLQLMRSDIDRKLDLGLALEVSRRDTQITTVVTGRLQRVGAEYTLWIEAVDAATGVVTEVVSGKSSEPAKLLRLSSDLAGRLVASLNGKPKNDLKLETVTTNSLRAAQLYTLANRMLVRQDLGGKDKNAAAEELLLEAIAEDQNFASAHLLLSWSIFRQRRPQAEFMPHADRALELSGSATEAERFFIRASYFSLAGELEAAIPIYQALVDRYPDHFWGVSNLAAMLTRTRRLAEAADAMVRLADLRPTSMRLIYRAYSYLVHMGDPRAEPLVERINDLATPDDRKGEWGYPLFLIESRTARRASFKGDLLELASELKRLDIVKDSIVNNQERQKAEAELAFLEFALGRLEAGWDRLETLGEDFEFRDEVFVVAAHLSGDRQALRHYLDVAASRLEARGHPFTIIPLLLARTGRVAEAEEMLDRIQLELDTKVTLQGALALARGNDKEVVDILEKAHQKMLFIEVSYFLAGEVLAEAYLNMEMPKRARRVLERASQQIERIPDFWGIPAWIRSQQMLVKLLRDMGEDTRAAEVAAELSRRLTLADENHPVKRWLAEASAS